MAKIGYVYISINDRYVREQMNIIQQWGVHRTIFNETEINLLQSGDEVVIYELKSLGKTVIQLATFIEKLTKKQIRLTIIKKDPFMAELKDDQFRSLLYELAEVESFAISERTSKGIQLAKQSGRIGGRPKLSEGKIKHIKYLYKSQGYTLREIADECDVSLGTAYKYVNTKNF